MSGLNGHEFKDIGYSHDELKYLLNKIDKGQVLSEKDYNKLIKEIGLNNISVFTGNYNDLDNLPDLDNIIREVLSSLKLPTNQDMNGIVELAKAELIDYIRKQLENKADKTHNHTLAEIDSLNTILSLKAGIDHLHDEQYYTKAAIDKKIGQIQADGFDSSKYATVEDLSAVNEALLLKAEKNHLHDIIHVDGLEDELNKKIDKDLVHKKEDVYTKAEINEMLKNSVDSDHTHDEFYTKEETDNNFVKVDELLEMIDDMVDTEDLTNLQNTIAKDIEAKADKEHEHDEFKQFENYYSKEEVDDKILDILQQGESGNGNISIDLEGYVKKSELEEALDVKADKEHSHDEYADKEHSHTITVDDVEGLRDALNEKSDIADSEMLQDIKDMLEEKADINHEHEEYANADHTHDIDAIDDLKEILDNKASVDDVLNNAIKLEELDNKANKDHVHEEYANVDHTHEEFSDFADKDHSHEGFAAIDHKHDEYALQDHLHDEYADKVHEHTLFIDSVTGLQAALDNKIEKDHVYSKEEVDDKILEILESEGDIVIDLEGYIKQSQLDEAIATKADAVHTHDGYANKSHMHTVGDLEGLQNALDNKANITDVPTNEDFAISMANKAELVHTHKADDIEDLQEVLDGLVTEEEFSLLEEKVNSKSDVNHGHDDYALKDHTHEDLYYSKEEVDTKLKDSGNAAELLAQANAYTDVRVAELTQNAPEGMNTFSGVAEVINTKMEEVNSSLKTMDTAIVAKADAVHEHSEYATIGYVDEKEVFETDQLTVNAVGGITSGTDLNGLTVKEILSKLLFPYVAPTISASGTPNGGTFEKGDNKTITNVKVVVTKKSEKIIKVEVLQGSTVLAVQEGDAVANGGTFNYPVSIPVNSTNVQLTARVTDATGAIRTATTGSFSFVYPYYVGVCAANATINESLIKGLTKRIEAKGAKNISYTTNNQRMIIAYPKSYGLITKVLDPNSFDVTSTFERIEVKITGLDGSAQAYYVYINSASSVEDFTMKFSY